MRAVHGEALDNRETIMAIYSVSFFEISSTALALDDAPQRSRRCIIP